tara:strand:+ start:1381 stop:1923 length:543 start_codon:yes stop_codon:yes gene_type:complete
MKNNKITKLNLDLVLKISDFPQLSGNLHNLNENRIFKYSFWEKVFLYWINVVLEKKNCELPKFIFEKKSFSLSLEIINNQEIAFMNQKWMKKKGPTDVLSFPIISDNNAMNELTLIELGDLFISLEMALEQSLEYKHSIEREMLWLASHGFLHLLGWEHNNEKELEEMLNFQEYLISRLD